MQINPAGGLSKDEIDRIINDAIFELQTASRILTSVMLYNPLKTMTSSDSST